MSKPITFEREPIISYDENPSIDWESMYNDLHIKLAEKDALLRESEVLLTSLITEIVGIESDEITNETVLKIRKHLEVSDGSKS